MTSENDPTTTVADPADAADTADTADAADSAAAPRTIVADVDTGIDDMLALIYLAGRHRSGEITLAAVTAAAGNTTAEHAARNSRWILELCGCPEVPVAVGAAQPLERPLVTTPETHGPTGLGYASAPESGNTTDGSNGADDALALWQQALQEAAEQNSSCHLLVCGPATLAAGTELTDQFASVTVMGGAVDYRGNTTPHAEWNFWVDPEAADIVLGLGPTLCNLAVTEQVTVDPHDVQRWQQMGQGSARLQALQAVVADALRFYFEFHQTQGEGYLAQVHDLFAAMVTTGWRVQTQPRYLTIDPDDRGAVVASSARDRRPVQVVTAVDPAAVIAEFDRVWRQLADG